MKCNHCKAEWTVNAAMSASIKTCPFCGNLLTVEQDDKLHSMKSTLRAIIHHSGIDGLKDGKRALAMFSDLAPQLKREKVMFSYLIQCDGHTLLLEALRKSYSEQVTCRGKIAQQMMQDLLVNEEVAYEACDAFWEAIGGSALEHRKNTKNSKKDTSQSTVAYSEKKHTQVPSKNNIPDPSKPKPTTPGIPSKPPVKLVAKNRTPAELYQEGLKFAKGYAAPKNLPLAIQFFTEAAKQGHVDSMFELAEIYTIGKEVEQDFDEAYLWYQRAAEKGHTRAMLQLGLCYMEGRGTRKNAVESMRWIRTAAARGDAKAKYMLSTSADIVAPGQPALNYEPAAKAGNPNAQFNYARCYATASGGVARNCTLAAEYYEKAAKQGHARAQLAIAEMYEKGNGVAISLAKAQEYYKEAAQSNEPDVAKQATAALRRFNNAPVLRTPSKIEDEPVSWFKRVFGGK